MKNNVLTGLSFLLLFIIALDLSAQEGRRLRFAGVDAAYDGYVVALKDYPYIRGDLSTYGTGNVSYGLLGYSSKWYTGLNMEIRSFNNKFGYLIGVRYSQLSSTLTANSSSATNEYFYYLLGQEGLNTDYLKIKSIEERSRYIGIPLEVRYFFYEPRFMRLYAKASTVISSRLNTDHKIEFFNQAMEAYNDDVEDNFEEPSDLLWELGVAVGLRIGEDDGPALNIEVNMPSFFLSKNASNLVDPNVGFGVRAGFQYPF